MDQTSDEEVVLAGPATQHQEDTLILITKANTRVSYQLSLAAGPSAIMLGVTGEESSHKVPIMVHPPAQRAICGCCWQVHHHMALGYPHSLF